MSVHQFLHWYQFHLCCYLHFSSPSFRSLPTSLSHQSNLKFWTQLKLRLQAVLQWPSFRYLCIIGLIAYSFESWQSNSKVCPLIGNAFLSQVSSAFSKFPTATGDATPPPEMPVPCELPTVPAYSSPLLGMGRKILSLRRKRIEPGTSDQAPTSFTNLSSAAQVVTSPAAQVANSASASMSAARSSFPSTARLETSLAAQATSYAAAKASTLTAAQVSRQQRKKGLLKIGSKRKDSPSSSSSEGTVGRILRPRKWFFFI